MHLFQKNFTGDCQAVGVSFTATPTGAGGSLIAEVCSFLYLSTH